MARWRSPRFFPLALLSWGLRAGWITLSRRSRSERFPRCYAAPRLLQTSLSNAGCPLQKTWLFSLILFYFSPQMIHFLSDVLSKMGINPDLHTARRSTDSVFTSEQLTPYWTNLSLLPTGGVESASKARIHLRIRVTGLSIEKERKNEERGGSSAVRPIPGIPRSWNLNCLWHQHRQTSTTFLLAATENT